MPVGELPSAGILILVQLPVEVVPFVANGIANAATQGVDVLVELCVACGDGGIQQNCNHLAGRCRIIDAPARGMKDYDGIEVDALEVAIEEGSDMGLTIGSGNLAKTGLSEKLVKIGGIEVCPVEGLGHCKSGCSLLVAGECSCPEVANDSFRWRWRTGQKEQAKQWNNKLGVAYDGQEGERIIRKNSLAAAISCIRIFV